MEVLISNIKVREHTHAPTLTLLVKIDSEYIQDFLSEDNSPMILGDSFLDALYEALDD